MKSKSRNQRGDRRKIQECARLDILTAMLMKTSVFRNVTSCRDLDAARNRDQCKQEWMSGLIRGRILSEQLTASQKGIVGLGHSWESRPIVTLCHESCTELFCSMGCDAIQSCK